MSENNNLKDNNGNMQNLKQILWRFCLRHPIDILAGLALAYYGFLVFVLEKDVFWNKTVMLGIVFVWGVWFFLKNFIKIAVLIFIVGCGAYGYYRYVNMDKINCEESGRVWNETTKTCEEKLTLWEELQNKWQKFKKSAVIIEKTTEKQQKSAGAADESKS